MTAPPETILADKTICLVGRFVAMSQREFQEFIENCKAHLVSLPNRRTDYVVIGDDSSSLTDPPWSTKRYRRACQLQNDGAPLRILSESEFYRLAALVPEDPPISSRQTLSDLARILHISGARLRQWVRWGLIRPIAEVHRLAFFHFPEVAAAKRLCQLMEHGFTMPQIRRQLEGLQAQFGGKRPPFSQLDLLQHNGRLLIRHRGQIIDSQGQRYFDFEEPAPFAPTLTFPATPEDVEDLFDRALHAESSARFHEALVFYRKAVQQDPANPVLYFNLGNTFFALERYDDARESFLRALEEDDRYAEAWNNLGNTYLVLEEWRNAIQAFGRALQLVPSYRDALHNLDLTFQLLAESRQTRLVR